MGCNCKSERNISPITGEKVKPKLSNEIIHYILKVFGYLLFVALLPIINLVILWVVFKILVLNDNLDFKAALLPIFEKYKRITKTDDDDDDDDDFVSEEEFNNLTEDDVEIIGVDKLTGRSNP